MDESCARGAATQDLLAGVPFAIGRRKMADGLGAICWIFAGEYVIDVEDKEGEKAHHCPPPKS